MLTGQLFCLSWLAFAAVGFFWSACCCTANGCSTEFTGYCFQFSISGVSNSPPPFGSDVPPCAFCADYNGTWLLVPVGPINPEDQVCTWATCRPPVCCGYPSPVTIPSFRFLMQPQVDGGDLQYFTISDGCNDATYSSSGPTLSLTQANIFSLSSSTSTCQGWPATISVTAIPPSARGSTTKTAQTFYTVGDEPNEANPAVSGPGPQPWQPSAFPSGLITPAPYISNSSGGQVTDWLICANLGFDLPSNYWITGASIQFKRWSDQAGVAFDDWITVGVTPQFNADDGGGPGDNEAQPGAWPLFSSEPGADIATYGGQFDDWLNLAAIQGYINSAEMCFAIGANLVAMTAGSAWVDPSTCQMTVYYVSLPCQDNCCACPGPPPSAYQLTVPSCPADCICGGSSWDYDPSCGCASQMGITYELPYSTALSVPTYRCVYTATFGHWTWALTITNISPDTRSWVLTAITDGGCAHEGGTFYGTFWVWGYEETSANRAIQPCDAKTLVLGGDSFDCFCSLTIGIGGGGFSGPSISVSPIP